MRVRASIEILAGRCLDTFGSRMGARLRGVVALALVFGFPAQPRASSLDLAYRADRPSLRILAPPANPQLPGLLEEFEPRPEPAGQPAEATLPRKPLLDVWERVREGFALPNLESPLVSRWQAWYLNRPQLLKAMFERSRRYVYHVVEELDKRGMPTELAFLPMVESGYDPMALSSAQASGLWQFIPSTGKNYKLEQNHLYDARRDVIASTSAALDYLQSLYEQFGDWHLALASYNWGENAVGRAIERNKARGQPSDYRMLVLPEETRNYIPKLQALKNIVANPGAFRLELEPVPNRPYFATVASARDIDVNVAAKLADMPLDEFLALNPAHNQPLMSKGTPAQIVLPVDRVESFVSKLAAYNKSLTRQKPAVARAPKKVSLTAPARYRVKAGATLSQIALELSVSETQRKTWNALARTGVPAGQELLARPN
jgi:membrane-bound lytic murein transglycosylase D